MPYMARLRGTRTQSAHRWCSAINIQSLYQVHPYGEVFRFTQRELLFRLILGF